MLRKAAMWFKYLACGHNRRGSFVARTHNLSLRGWNSINLNHGCSLRNANYFDIECLHLTFLKHRCFECLPLCEALLVVGYDRSWCLIQAECDSHVTFLPKPWNRPGRIHSYKDSHIGVLCFPLEESAKVKMKLLKPSVSPWYIQYGLTNMKAMISDWYIMCFWIWRYSLEPCLPIKGCVNKN